ncbi:sae1 [Symbiodinium sp. CCMP2456]|nr:sae1 [Symbiodinium sp. CCMP2456]
MAAITGDQVAVYDRQLRLWGVQAQQRLLNAKVLIWGLEGSNVEACKNLVLAGISLTLRDHRTVGAADVGFNYFLRPEDLGQSRATCASKRVQEMNPLCTVSCSSDRAETGSDEAKLKDLVKGFDIVIVGLSVLGYDFELASSLDAACRSLGAGFMLTVAAGEIAFFFSDQNEHVMQERSSAQGAAESAGPQDPENFSFPPFSHFLSGIPRMLHGKCDASFKLIGLFASFLRSGGKATPSAASDFEAHCRDTVKCQPSVDGIPSMKEVFGHFFVEPLIHVASVLGGLLSQEVIKAMGRYGARL